MPALNSDALIAVLLFAGVLLAIFGFLYAEAGSNHAPGQANTEGLRLLRWALLGYAVIYGLLAVTTFLV